jgi:hypothetical protein
MNNGLEVTGEFDDELYHMLLVWRQEEEHATDG